MKNLKLKLFCFLSLLLTQLSASDYDPSLPDPFCDISNRVQSDHIETLLGGTSILNIREVFNLMSSREERVALIAGESRDSIRMQKANQYLEDLMDSKNNMIGGRRFRKVVIEPAGEPREVQVREIDGREYTATITSPAIIEYVSGDSQSYQMVIKPTYNTDYSQPEDSRHAVDIEIGTRVSGDGLSNLKDQSPVIENFTEQLEESPVSEFRLFQSLNDRGTRFQNIFRAEATRSGGALEGNSVLEGLNLDGIVEGYNTGCVPGARRLPTNESDRFSGEDETPGGTAGNGGEGTAGNSAEAEGL